MHTFQEQCDNLSQKDSFIENQCLLCVSANSTNNNEKGPSIVDQNSCEFIYICQVTDLSTGGDVILS